MNENLLKAWIHYEPLTGAFTWIQTAGGTAQAGSVAGTVHGTGRRVIRFRGRGYMAHRLAWLYMTGLDPRGDIDHINGNPLDNRWVNLRDVDKQINAQNQRRAMGNNKRTGMLGVTGEQGAYRARIFVDGRRHHLGSYPTPEAAHEAYLTAKRRLHEGCTL